MASTFPLTNNAITAPIIIAPPLTGCTTLAGMCPGASGIIDVTSDHFFTDRSQSLSDRKLRLGELARNTAEAAFICMPCLPDDDCLDTLHAIVIIPAAALIRRMRRLGSSPMADGHRIAALAWRDEALILSAKYDLPTYAALAEVPLLSDLQVSLKDLVTTSPSRGGKHDQATPATGSSVGPRAYAQRVSPITSGHSTHPAYVQRHRRFNIE
jgi:hypothetical protein